MHEKPDAGLSPTPEQIRFWLRELRTPEILLKVGDSCGVERASALEILDQVREAVTRWREFAEEMRVPGSVSRAIEE